LLSLWAVKTSLALSTLSTNSLWYKNYLLLALLALKLALLALLALKSALNLVLRRLSLINLVLRRLSLIKELKLVNLVISLGLLILFFFFFLNHFQL
jgi:hypothetical protein